MFTGTARRAGAMATASVILIGAAILRGSPAAADPNQDDQFLALLDQRGIPALANPPSLIVTARQICGRLDSGMPVDGVVESMTTFAVNNDPSLRRYPRDRLTRTFSRFVSTAVQVYCPFHQDQIASFSANPVPRTTEPPHRVAAYPRNAITSECDVRHRPPAPDNTSTPAAWQVRTPIGVARPPHSIVGGVFVTSHTWGGRSDCTAQRDDPAPLIETIPAGETIAPKPPQIPAPPPPANILIPPRAPAPSQPPRQPPPLPQQPPSPQEPAPPPQEPPPPPQQVEPPVVAPQPGGTAGGGGGGDGGAGGGGSGSGGGGSGGGGSGGGGGPAAPSPTRPMPPGIIRVLP
ncbi:DUF732 domain-containing protein [Mycobacterium gastri]|uniref:DUF732 domain-containing protein n=1 Tax=Mycobacterium gastri TaxID=1777 RepID=A0A1X1VC31_MYCGS|nr:DUF732 domain-containing protein [Mycobacterium gastri]ETW23124.1 hypothetical protein MGAST_15900 [Mycobacterium gastri 'Wayne']ORV66627.1 hypothetical protein AWC07_10635 [Mycobacterium gastri]